jgi:hypothetical protein
VLNCLGKVEIEKLLHLPMAFAISMFTHDWRRVVDMPASATGQSATFTAAGLVFAEDDGGYRFA